MLNTNLRLVTAFKSPHLRGTDSRKLFISDRGTWTLSHSRRSSTGRGLRTTVVTNEISTSVTDGLKCSARHEACGTELAEIIDNLEMRYRRRLWLQLDGCPAHFTSYDSNFLKLIFKRYTRFELVNRANGPLLQHENSMNIRDMSPEQDSVRHQAMETAKMN
ncbi:hypothetical protein EVAR_21217_1 [Eumeta japonica]|uniref:Uncharacterized protein n=1 Tax=Eumeta variegata TaxID=151549 RepID=A0A4C1UQ44_EUMVA|nr:hypothetical protein EVAR_21217_1 [Eumeta japonica]